MNSNSHPQVIDSFQDEYEFLSNYYKCSIKGGGKTYASASHYYNSLREVSNWDSLRWDGMKMGVMKSIISRKFWPGTALAQSLLGTDSKLLIYGNREDQYWGMTWNDNNRAWFGNNYLGMLLVTRRTELQAYDMGWTNVVPRRIKKKKI